MDAPGTYGWILHQDAKNATVLGSIPAFDELFAKAALAELAQA